MTTNEINMFAKAKEIQEEWKPEVGDRVWFKDTHEGHTGTKHFIVKRVGFARPLSEGNFWTIGGEGFKEESFYDDRLIFLPSIEQMAEMWEAEKSGVFFYRISEFIDNYERAGADAPLVDIDWPPSIIVLAFIQHELYGLTWSEEKGEWVDG